MPRSLSIPVALHEALGCQTGVAPCASGHFARRFRRRRGDPGRHVAPRRPVCPINGHRIRGAPPTRSATCSMLSCSPEEIDGLPSAFFGRSWRNWAMRPPPGSPTSSAAAPPPTAGRCRPSLRCLAANPGRPHYHPQARRRTRSSAASRCVANVIERERKGTADRKRSRSPAAFPTGRPNSGDRPPNGINR